MIEISPILDRLENIEKLIHEQGKPAEWLDLKASTKYAGLSISTLKRAVNAGKLKVARGTGKMMFKPIWIDSLLINGSCKRMNPMEKERLKNAMV